MPPLTLGELQNLRQTVLWFRFHGADEVSRVTADRLRNEKDRIDFVESLLHDLRKEKHVAKVPAPGEWCLRQDGNVVDLTNMQVVNGATYEIISNCTEEKKPAAVSTTPKQSWTCSELQHTIDNSSHKKSVVVLPLRTFLYLTLQWQEQWISKKKNLTRKWRYDEECIAEEAINLQQLVHMMGALEEKIQSIDVFDLNVTDANPLRVLLSNLKVPLMCLRASRKLRVMIITTL